MKQPTSKPVVDKTSCVGCGICARNCPSNAIRVDGAAKIDTERCTACGNCVRVCPQNAIKLDSESSKSQAKRRKLDSVKDKLGELSEEMDEIQQKVEKLKGTSKS